MLVGGPEFLFINESSFFLQLEVIKPEILLFVMMLIFLMVPLMSYRYLSTSKAKLIFTINCYIYIEIFFWFFLFFLFFKHYHSSDVLDVLEFPKPTLWFNNTIIHDIFGVIMKVLLTFLFILYCKICKLNIFFNFNKNNNDLAYEKFFIILSSLFFMCLIISAIELNLIYLCFEGITFCVSLLIAFEGKKLAIESAAKYFSLSVLSSTFLIFGVSLLYSTIGITDFYHLKLFFLSYHFQLAILPIVISIFLIIFGFLFKLAAYPGHIWLMDIYNGCSFSLLFFLTTIYKFVVFIIFLKFLIFSVFYLYFYWRIILLISGFGSLIVSGFGLYNEMTIKRFIAYSAIGQTGFLLLGMIGCITMVGLQAVFSYLFYYILCNCLFFWILNKCQIYYFFNFSGNLIFFKNFYNKSTVDALLLTGCLLSFAGLPPFLGFFTKYQILLNLYYTSGFFLNFLLFLIILINILIAFGYIRIVRLIWFTFIDSNSGINNMNLNFFGTTLINNGFYIKFFNKLLNTWVYRSFEFFLFILQLFGFYSIYLLTILSSILSFSIWNIEDLLFFDLVTDDDRYY